MSCGVATRPEILSLGGRRPFEPLFQTCLINKVDLQIDVGSHKPHQRLCKAETYLQGGWEIGPRGGGGSWEPPGPWGWGLEKGLLCQGP